MTRRIGLTTFAVLGTLVAGVCTAVAQTPASTTAQPAADTPPPAVDLYSAADAQAVLDARLIALKTVIGLTPEQAKLWDGVEAAIRQAAKNAGMRAEQRAKAAPAMNFLDVLERLADAEAARAEELKKVIAAAKPLVASLSDEQKRRIPAFLGMTDLAGAPQPISELWIFEDEHN